MWTRYGGPGWTRSRHIFEAVFAPFTEALVAALHPTGGETVLDVGCGNGGLSRAIVRRGGIAVGIDIAEPMVAAARELVPEARFVVGDAQVDSLGELAPGGFDAVTSQFGVMFFDDPVAAFANIAAATRRGGRLVFTCWRTLEENPIFTLGTRLLVERMPEPPPRPAPGSPGPTMLADPAATTAILTQAGWTRLEIAPFDATCNFGIAGSDGVEERVAMIQASTAGQRAAEQLQPILGDNGWAALLDEVRDELRANMTGGGVAFPGAVWIVSATRP
jgi:SAM-dependent methyltransferase